MTGIISTLKVSDIKNADRIEYNLEKDLDTVEFCTFTHIQEAQRMLHEIEQRFTESDNEPFGWRFYVLNAIVENQLYNFKTSDTLFNKAIQLVEIDGNTAQIIETYTDYLGTLINMKNIERTVFFIDKTRRLLTQMPNDVLQSRLMCREAYMHWLCSEYDLATELFFQSQKIFGEIPENNLTVKDMYFQTLVHTGKGMVYEKTKDLKRCVTAYEKSVVICEAHGIKSRLAWHYLNVGKAHVALDNYVQGEYFFEKVLQTDDDHSEEARANATANIGFCLFKRGDFDKALVYFHLAENFYVQHIGNFENLAKIAHWQGLLFKNAGQQRNAEKKLVEALRYAGQIDNASLQSRICKDIAAFFAARNNFKEAYDYECLHVEFQRKYFEEINSIKVNELEFKHEVEKRRKETEMLRLQANELQLKALRAQMNPHFLFNAMNAIQSFVNADDRVTATKYLAKFAQLMRTTLENSEQEVVTLENEIEFLQDYLLINQKLRFDERFQFSITVSDDIENDIIGIPTMIIQPYIENAIEHGIKPKRTGFIKIHFELFDDDTMLCIVEDNGVGRARVREIQEETGYFKKHTSHGTRITEKRLELLNQEKPNRFFVRIIDLIHQTTQAACGTRVEIKFPIFPFPQSTGFDEE